MQAELLTHRQRSFDELGTPLAEVSFCVIDLETTGGSPATEAITEVAAVMVRGGEVLGTLQTLVDPGRAIPVSITVLTGITDAMVTRAPRIESILPTLLEFVGDAVIVGHNVRFDIGFLDAALIRSGRPRLSNRALDTCALARRLVRDEVPNCKLDTLATRLRLDHKPTHRALDDVLATVDLLHLLIERATSFGVTGLDDLLSLPKLAGHAQAPKLRLTEGLPRSPGVYLFRDRRGDILYVGKATDLRARVRSYFSSDDRRKVGALLCETAAIDHHVCDSALEAGVREVRLIHEHQPRYNRQGRNRERHCYVKLTSERFPRLSVVNAVRSDGCLYVGPLPSRRVAQLVVEAIETVVPLRRCAQRVGRGVRDGPCTAAQLGVAMCPCTGAVDPGNYSAIVEAVRRGLTDDPAVLLEPLRARMRRLGAEQRFEEASSLRDRAHALAHTLATKRRHDALRRSRLEIELPGGVRVELAGGRLATCVSSDQLAFAESPWSAPLDRPPTPAEAAELAVASSFLDRYAHKLRIISCDGDLSYPIEPIPSFRARNPPVSREA